MSTVEKLLVEIFQRKNFIIEQAKQQTESYIHNLAAKLAVYGIPPPAWAWNSNQSSHPTELNKEELISRLLHRHPRPPACCSRAHYSLYSNPVGTGDNAEISHGCFIEPLDCKKAIDGQNYLDVPAISCKDDVGYTYDKAPDMDVSITSPEDQLDEGIVNTYNASDQSLARITRSMSRQKALELRSSEKSLTPCYAMHHNDVQDADNIVATELVLCKADQSVSTSPEDNKQQGESLVGQFLTGSLVFIERKELNVNMPEDVKISTSRSEKKPLNNMSEQMDHFSLDSAASVDEQTSGKIKIAEESIQRSDVYGKGKKVTTHSLDSNVQDVPDASTTNYVGSEPLFCGVDQLASTSSSNNKESGELGFLVARSPEKYSVSLEPKELDVNMPEKMECLFADSAASVDKGLSCNINQLSTAKESTERSDVQSKGRKVGRGSCYLNAQENLRASTDKYVAIGEIETLKISQDGTEACLNGETSEVRDEISVMQSIIDESHLKNHPLKLCFDLRPDTSPLQHTEGKPENEANDVVSLVSNASRSSTCRESYSDNLILEPSAVSHDGLVEKEELANSACDIHHEISQTHTKDYQALPCLDDEVSGQHADSPLAESGSMISGADGSADPESWPQMKRRKIKHQEANRLTTSPCFRMGKLQSIKRIPSSTYLMNIKHDADLPDAFRLAKSTGREMNELIGFDSTELESTSDYLSREDRFGKEQIEDRSSSSIDEESEIALDGSLAEMKSVKSGGLYAGGIRIITNIDYLDSGGPDRNKLDNTNYKNLAVDGMKKSFVDCEWKDGKRSHCALLSPSDSVDQSLPVLEGFRAHGQSDSGELDFSADEGDIDRLNFPSTMIERASFIANMCKSAIMDRPLSEFQGAQNLSKSVPNGLLESLDTGSTLPSNDDFNKQPEFGDCLMNNVKDSFEHMPYPDCLPRFFFGNLHASPVGRFYERLSSDKGSSEKRSSTNPDLTCFRIEEDPCVSEGSETMDVVSDDAQGGTNDPILVNLCDKKKSLSETADVGLVPPVSNSMQDDIQRADSAVSVSALRYKAQGNLKGLQTSTLRKQTPIAGADWMSKANESIKSKKAKQSINRSVNRPGLRSISSLKRQEHKLSLKESRKNNIVSNITSFLPLVQQKPAAAICTGKREVKVKALEAAEAAKRLEEQRENERKMKKEAFKSERAKLEEKNLKQKEFEKKKKEDERKRKDADNILKKRLREEEERKDKDKKKMRIEARQRQREQEVYLHAKKEENDKDHSKAEKRNNKKELIESKKQHSKEVVKGDDVFFKKTEHTWVPTHHKELGTSGDSLETGKAMHTVDKSPSSAILMVKKSNGMSYEISPYHTDDEDEDDEELSPKKSIPLWASKSYVALRLTMQEALKPDVVFPPESFGIFDKVLPPRRVLQKQMLPQ